MNRPAVVLFARSPEGEAAAKGMRSAAPLFRAVVAAWLREARRHGAMPVIACTREDQAALRAIAPEIERGWIEQRGASFSERVVRVAEDAFGLGHASVILAAIDAPPHNLRRALESLQRGVAVLAPSRDGGVNYIGLTSVDRDLLENLTAQRCREHFEQLLIVETLTDVDSAGALAIASLERGWQPFLQSQPLTREPFLPASATLARVAQIRPPPR